MDHINTALDILRYVGGEENVVSVAHCATRLRFVLKDENRCNKKELEDIKDVKGVFTASGQVQIILGTGIVNKVMISWFQYQRLMLHLNLRFQEMQLENKIYGLEELKL